MLPKLVSKAVPRSVGYEGSSFACNVWSRLLGTIERGRDAYANVDLVLLERVHGGLDWVGCPIVVRVDEWW